MSIEKRRQYFGIIEDPSCPDTVKRRLFNTLWIAMAAVIACAES